MIEDISEEQKDNASNPNIEWKKKGFDHKEQVTRKINHTEALKHKSKKKNNFNNKNKNPITPANLPNGLKNLHEKVNKIKDIFDEEDEEDKNITAVKDSNDLENSLLNALSSEEKRTLKQKNDYNQTKIHQNAGKLEAVNEASKLAKQAGIGGLKRKDADKLMADATYNKGSMTEALKKDLAKELKIKNPGRIPASKHKDLIKGIKEIKEKGGRVENMSVDKVAEAGRVGGKRVAEIIYKESPKEVKNKIHKTAEVKQIIEKTGRTSMMPKSQRTSGIDKQNERVMDKEQEKQIVKEIDRGRINIRQNQRGHHRS